MRVSLLSLKQCLIFTTVVVLLLIELSTRRKLFWSWNLIEQVQQKSINSHSMKKPDIKLEPKIKLGSNHTWSSLIGTWTQNEINNVPWYFLNGTHLPKATQINRNSGKRLAQLFPWEDRLSDRITNQLMFIPPNYEEIVANRNYKMILLYNGLDTWNVKEGFGLFSSCPVLTCMITDNRTNAPVADLILFKDHTIPAEVYRPPETIYMIYILECPMYTMHFKNPGIFNWTATYRLDSDLVAPYGKWEYYDPRITQIKQEKNYALNKSKKVAWFVSHCGARNGRLQYANDLQRHIEVDIYGQCGTFVCPRSTPDQCFELLDRDYKFYLAFENANCKDYVTEKFFINALNRNILPIVMGARPEDYKRIAPNRSYIHVDDFSSPKELADYLNILDKNDELYNSYFKWKGTGEFINTHFWCRLCALLHDEPTLKLSKYYENINDWWREDGTCICDNISQTYNNIDSISKPIHSKKKCGTK